MAILYDIACRPLPYHPLGVLQARGWLMSCLTPCVRKQVPTCMHALGPAAPWRCTGLRSWATQTWLSCCEFSFSPCRCLPKLCGSSMSSVRMLRRLHRMRLVVWLPGPGPVAHAADGNLLGGVHPQDAAWRSCGCSGRRRADCAAQGGIQGASQLWIISDVHTLCAND